MKATTSHIISEIKSEDLYEAFNNAMINNPGFDHQERTIEEAFSQFQYIRELLDKSSKDGLLDDLSATKRNEISSLISSLRSTMHSVPHLISRTDKLYDLLQTLGLTNLSEVGRDAANDIKDVIKLKNHLNSLIKRIEDKLPVLDEIDEVRQSASMILKKIEDFGTLSENNKEKILKVAQDTSLTFSEVTNILKNAQTNESEIETKKLTINTFFENVDEYKARIDNLEAKAAAIIAKESQIEKLISEAENALNLKSAEGISAAFSAQYKSTTEQTVGWWMTGAITFVILSLVLTGWIVTGYRITDPNSWSSIVGRIAAVMITIGSAAFCAKQYLKTKNLCEDYAYKAVLAKSIVAFTKEIKKRDESKVAEYLTTVLNEIHKDPLRRNEKPASESKLNAQSIIEKVIDKLPGN